MTHDIRPPEHHVAGESLRQEFHIEKGGAAKDISGADVSWYLLPAEGADTATAVLDGSDADVDVSIVSAADGRIDVVLDQGATDGYGGQRLWQRLVVDDSGPGKQIWSGDFPIDFP